jgi:pimeloyl-ACP methyl ester carboxylesterase
MGELNFLKSNYIETVFKSREKFIPEVGEQFKKETRATIDLNGKELNIDYRIISIEEKEKAENNPVILLPGFGSGWEGISELGFSLACEGREIILPSMPGYGNSDNPPEKYFQTESYDNEAGVLDKLLEKIGKENKKFHLVGHSMGSEILTTFAKNYPEKVASLVLLNPAGVEEKENPIMLGSKFILSGIIASTDFTARSVFSGEGDYEKKLRNYIPKTKSPFTKERLLQRMAEAKKLAKGKLLEKLKDIEAPIVYISGELDLVFPPGKENNKNSQLTKIVESVNNESRFEKSVMAGLRHNTTIAPDEITAANIEHYLEKAERG